METKKAQKNRTSDSKMEKEFFDVAFELFASSSNPSHWQVARLLLYLKQYSTDLETLKNICDFVLQNHPNNEPINPISWKHNKPK